MNTVIVLPRLHSDHALGEIDQIWQCPSHGTKDAGYTLLARHTCLHTHLWPSPCGAAEGIDAREMGGDPDGASNIGANTDSAASVSQQSAFTAGGSAR